MNQFKNDSEMLKELDDFMYKCKGFNSKLRESLINKIGEFLKQNKLDSDQHNFVSWNSSAKPKSFICNFK
ncbi:MAG: hypothetical protein OEV44_00250 [Spirochaetota bacterium]|nr:hypothetical protein [Spirochaetota bacterium]